MDVQALMAETMRRHMPAIKTQAQFDAVMVSLEATKELMSAILEGDSAKEASSFQALQAAMDVARKATELHEKLGEVPEGSLSDATAPFVNPPAQFTEQEVQKGLLRHLETLSTLDQLTAWYASTKEHRDQIKTQSLRNELIDAIRSKKNSLQ